MLTPLPSTPLPTAPGSQPLPLPQGATPQQGAASAQLLSVALPVALPAAAGAARPAPAAAEHAGPDLSLPLAETETALASALANAETTTSSASSRALVTAQMIGAGQMIGTETAPLQALLAQQAATRALPHAPPRSEPRRDGPAKATDHAPTDTFDPHAPHLPLTLGGRHDHEDALADDRSPGTDHAIDTDPRDAPLRRRDLALHPPPLDPPAALPSPWVIVGATFTSIVILAALLLL
ncbi:hypothetical protein [Rhodobacter maris]|uniref:Uncharacterized protein n=1 Tax=Rhodobacter maris TaxID=446682 RepID=A0A285TB04_9RHOB|nr:hypothetical protein [Rhodobacter maris]SOC18966.1 hypothetical protein SAMN05877831_11742 [Rhodobacter maris]